MSLENIGEAPIGSLNASLTGFPAAPTAVYSFAFNASSSNPLLADQTAKTAPTLVAYGLTPTKQYPLTVTGTLLNGTRFSYVQQVWVVTLGPD